MFRNILIPVLTLFSSLLLAQSSDTTFIQADDAALHAVLTKPLATGNYPLAVIIAGSGPTDLNGNNSGMNNNSLRYLSDALVENKIASVRFDKRGIGKSTITGFKEDDLTIDNYANDLVAIIKHYKVKGYSDIYLIGHSEGSLIGLIAMQDIKIDGFVSIAGAGSPAHEIINKQLKPKLPPAIFSQVEIIIDSLKNKHQVKNVPPQLNALFRQSVQPYLISWFNYNPADLIKKLRCPLMIIQGDKDIQVDLEEANKLMAASNNGKLLIVNNMNHVLKTINGDVNENISSYSNPDLPINQNLVNGLADFINKDR
jgi:pimeloyl-ACP methyl ester carboxylesterase